MLDRLGRCLKLFVFSEITSCHEFASQFGLAIFYTRKTPKTIAHTDSPARLFIWMKQRPVIARQRNRRKWALTPTGMGAFDPSSSDNLNGNGGVYVWAHVRAFVHVCAVADRGVSGPWGPQFCGALCNGETQRLLAGGAGSPPVGSEAEPRRQTHFGDNILKIGWKSGILVAVCTHNSDLITDHGKSRFPSRLDLYEICRLSGNHSHIIITCSRLATKATVTPDRTISGSYDWLRLGQGANDR